MTSTVPTTEPDPSLVILPASYRRRANLLLADHRSLRARVTEEKESLAILRAEAETGKKARAVLQGIAKAVQEVAHRHIAAVVTRCLKAVFGDEAYEFRIEFEEKRGKTEAKVVFYREDHEVIPRDEGGGGALDVAAFSVRLACLMAVRPRKRLFLALDQPFSNLSSDHHPRLAQLLLELCREFELQMLIVTHAEGLEVGKVVRL